MCRLSENPNITWPIVLENTHIGWDYECLSENPNITLDIVKDNPNIDWDYGHLCENPNITWDMIQSNPDLPWESIYFYYSNNPNNTWEFVRDNPDKDWSYSNMCMNPIITLDIVQNNPSIGWSYRTLSYNPNITWEMVSNNSDKDWSYINMSKNPNITWDIVKSNSDRRWCYGALCSGPNIACSMIWDDLYDYCEFPRMVSNYNPNATWRDIHYSGSYHQESAFHGDFNRWNASHKIQKVFRTWRAKTRVQITCITLLEVHISSTQVQVPAEIWSYISHFTFICREKYYDPSVEKNRYILIRLIEIKYQGKTFMGKILPLFNRMYDNALMFIGNNYDGVLVHIMKQVDYTAYSWKVETNRRRLNVRNKLTKYFLSCDKYLSASKRGRKKLIDKFNGVYDSELGWFGEYVFGDWEEGLIINNIMNQLDFY